MDDGPAPRAKRQTGAASAAQRGPRTAMAGLWTTDALRLTSSGAREERREPVAEEVPVALLYNWFPFAVMMATPADLDDFAVGFSLTEQIVAQADDILGLRQAQDDGDGIELRVSVSAERGLALRERHRRNLLGGSSCGLCGSGSFAEVLRRLPPVVSRQVFAPAAIWAAMEELPSRQTLNHRVGAVHAAAFVEHGGRILAVREDVGRHNALDKVIGCVARRHVDPASGFVVVSSRCSYEMVHKTAAAGIPLIASVSAPTSKGIELAAACGVGLAAFARDGRFTVYAARERIAGAG